MRNITCTSLICVLASAATAEAPAPGCFARDYTAAHLAAHPDQIVTALRLEIYEQPGFSDSLAALEVQLAQQGRIAGTEVAGQVLAQTLVCSTDAGTPFCAVECDGGFFEITRRDKETLTFRTDYLLVGDTEGCGGVVDLVEKPRQPVSYRLDAVPPSVCEGLR